MIKPMLCQEYTESLFKRFSDWYFKQPKYDGMRLIWYENKLYSRNGKPVVSCPSILKVLESNFLNINLDGELYAPGMDFSSIISSTRRTVNILENPNIKFYVFDLINTQPFFQRFLKLKEIFKPFSIPYGYCVDYCPDETAKVVLSRTVEYTTNDVESVDFSSDFEGNIYRNPMGSYVFGKRYNGLLKQKTFLDDEALIVGFTEGEGKYQGSLGNIKCRVNDIPFEIGTGFNDNLRNEIWNNQDKYLGQYCTFKYQELTQNRVPRFPVFKCIRHDK